MSKKHKQKPQNTKNPQNQKNPQSPSEPTYHISSSAIKGWQPRAEAAYKRIKNKVGAICGPKLAAQYVKTAREKHLPLMGYFQHYHGQFGAIWARNMANAVYAQIIYQNYQISRRSIQIAPRPLIDLMNAMRTNPDAGRGIPDRHLDDQCIFIDVGNLDLETSLGDGIFLSVFNSTNALYCCIHADEYYCGEISPELAASSDPYAQPRKDLQRKPYLLKLVYLAWSLFGLLTGGLRLLNEDELIITQDLGEIRDYTPVRTIMSYPGYDTLMFEGSTYLNLLIKTMRWSNQGMSDMLDQMGVHGTDNFLGVKRAKLFYALQAWANSRQTFRIDLRKYQNVHCPKAADLPLGFFDPDHLPYSAFYVELTGYGAPDQHYGVLIAKSKELSIVSGEDRPEVFLFCNGLVFNEYPTLELFERLEQAQVTVSAEDLLDLTAAAEYADDFREELERTRAAQGIKESEGEDVYIPVDFTFAAVLAVIQVIKTTTEEFILRQVREVHAGKRVKRDKVISGEKRDISWYLTPRVVTSEIKTDVMVPLEQLIPPSQRTVRKVQPSAAKKRASPCWHAVRPHPHVYWTGPRGHQEPKVVWLEEFHRGVKPVGLTLPGEVIHVVK